MSSKDQELYTNRSAAMTRTPRSRLRPLLFVLVLIAVIPAALATETWLIPQGEARVLSVSTGEVFVLSLYDAGGYDTALVWGGATNPIYLRMKPDYFPLAFAGPMQLLFGSNCSHFLSFTRLTNTAFHSLVLTADTTNAVINIPAGKTLRWFSSLPNGNHITAIARGTNEFSGGTWGGWGNRGQEFAGPLEMRLNWSGVTTICTYYITDDFTLFPQTGLLLGPTGTFEVSVLKSVDLSNWFPVMVQPVTADQKAFYRLRLAR
ncbi:MAG: hypothetical protein HZA90_26785 [Verrucomicrobia bacterium]|nr:hypothetical protein [Verrucomicrobiota bacterium]